MKETDKKKALTAICFILDDPDFFRESKQKMYIRNYCNRMFGEEIDLEYRSFSRNMFRYTSLDYVGDPSEVPPMEESPVIVDNNGTLRSNYPGCGDDELTEADLIIFSSVEVLGYLPETAWDAYVILRETQNRKPILFARNPSFNLNEKYAPPQKTSGISAQYALDLEIKTKYQPLLNKGLSDASKPDQKKFESVMIIDEVEAYATKLVEEEAQEKAGRRKDSKVFNREVVSRRKYVLRNAKKLFGNASLSEISHRLSRGNAGIRKEIFYGVYMEDNPQTSASRKEFAEKINSKEPHLTKGTPDKIKHDHTVLLTEYNNGHDNLADLLGWLNEMNKKYEASQIATDARKKKKDVVRQRINRKGDEADTKVDVIIVPTKFTYDDKLLLIKLYEDRLEAEANKNTPLKRNNRV